MAEDNNVILDYDEIENLDEAKLQEAKQKFKDTTYTLLRDTARTNMRCKMQKL